VIKVLLINPPQTYHIEFQGFGLHFPIGLMSIAAVVRDICHVEIFDCVASGGERRKDNQVTYGASPEEIRRVINEKRPDVVGISVPFTTQYRNAELVATIAKEVDPKIITVFGGPDPSVRFKHILENQYCDYCVIGEGEQTFYEFIKNFHSPSSLESIKGLAYKRNGIIHYEPRPFNTNLDALPFPAFDLVDMKQYLHNKHLYKYRSDICENSISIITSRGCPYNCVFCSIKLHMGQMYRSHSPNYVMKLLRLCRDKYGISNFHFEDDNLSLDRRRFETILDCIIKENLRIQWDTPNGIRADSLNYSILKKMKQAGCKKISFAIESGNQRVLDEVIHKKSKLEYMITIAKYCKELKIPATAFYVIGFPGETISEMKDTTNLAITLYRKYDLVSNLSVATPLYGTELYEICMRDHLIKGNPTFEELAVATQASGNPMISTREFSQKDVKRLINEYAKRLSAAYPRYFLQHPRELVAWIELVRSHPYEVHRGAWLFRNLIKDGF
jgi:magnesium-protoporphyrin IX monomethyl ester (oxidative) cyclase